MYYFILSIISLLLLFYDSDDRIILISNLNITTSDRSLHVKNRCISHCDILLSLLRSELPFLSCYSIDQCHSIMLRNFAATKISKRDIEKLEIGDYYFLYDEYEIFFIRLLYSSRVEYRISHLLI